MGYALFVMGPAGSGKTTFCKQLAEYGLTVGRVFKLANLDPANIDERTSYILDIREYVTVDEVQESTDLGPNGGLVLTLEEFSINIQDFEIEDVYNDYVIFDCPGQLELFTHSNAICNIVKQIEKHSSVAAVYLMESQFLMDTNKYLHGCLTALIAMAKLELPHMNILTKTDMMDSDKDLLNIQENIRNMVLENNTRINLLVKIYDFLSENGCIVFKPLFWDDENCMFNIMYEIDLLMHYWDDAELKDSLQE